MISIEDIWKEYQLGNTVDLGKNFREALTQWFAKNDAKRTGDNGSPEKFWALREINLEIEHGKSLGLIGNNGAGKSTLLKVLSRITKPTRGQIVMNGSVASLLEVGTGFHPELSGRENIFLYGAIMGMTKQEIGRKFDEIVDYAGVEQFLDTPVKRYSSGMYVRLAFSIAAHVEPDILIVDEVLAVGDREFREKCLGKMEDVADSGRTVIFVSHNMSSITSLCQQTVWLDQGSVKKFGNTSDVVAAYKNHQQTSFSSESLQSYFTGSLYGKAAIDIIKINGATGSYSVHIDINKDIEIYLEGEAKCALEKFQVSVSIYHGDARLFTIRDADEPRDVGAGRFACAFTVPAETLCANSYALCVGMISRATGEWLWGKSVSEMVIIDSASELNSDNADIFSSIGSGRRLSSDS